MEEGSERRGGKGKRSKLEKIKWKRGEKGDLRGRRVERGSE